MVHNKGMNCRKLAAVEQDFRSDSRGFKETGQCRIQNGVCVAENQMLVCQSGNREGIGACERVVSGDAVDKFVG